MTNKKTPKYELKDFFTKTKNEEPSKMDLLLDGNKTGHYLMVKGGQAKSVQRSIIKAQVAYADLSEECEKIKDKQDKISFERDGKEKIEIMLALDLITDWSFGEMDGKQELTDLLLENKGLALAVFGFANTASNYLEKK